MNNSKRVIIAFVFAALFLFVGWLFWPFVFNNFLKPIATVVWLLLRIFVLSIDQTVFWTAIIFAGLFFLYRILSKSQIALPSEESLEWIETINTFEYWHSQFLLNNRNYEDDRFLKKELANLLASLYTSKQHTSTKFEIYDSLEKGQIPLPEHIHTFLFPQETQEPKRLMKKLIQSVRRTPRKWIRRWTGQETAERYRMVDEVLNFMETSLEIKNDV